MITGRHPSVSPVTMPVVGCTRRSAGVSAVIMPVVERTRGLADGRGQVQYRTRQDGSRSAIVASNQPRSSRMSSFG